MKTILKFSPRKFSPKLLAAIFAASLFAHPVLAQDDPGMAAMQAAQQATQASQMAAQQAMQASQQAAQQAMQDSQNAMQMSMQSDQYSSSYPQQEASPSPVQPNGPVPAEIAKAHTVFFASQGADAGFPVDSTQVFNDVSQKLQAWGHYQLVDSPAEADLVFQLRELSPITDVGGYRNGVYAVHSPTYQLTILDRKTQIALWTITSPAYLAGKRQVFAHWVDLSEDNLVSRIKVLAGQPLSSQETAELETYPKTHYGEAAAIGAIALVGLGVAGGAILHHEYEESLSNQKAQQDAFCKANNIPLSECAGG